MKLPERTVNEMIIMESTCNQLKNNKNKHMKTLIKKQSVLIIATLLLGSTSYAQWGKSIKGNGIMKTITRTTSEYDGIKCAGNMNFVIVRGSEGNLKIEGEENLLEYIITEVKNNNLIVKIRKKYELKIQQK